MSFEDIKNVFAFKINWIYFGCSPPSFNELSPLLNFAAFLNNNEIDTTSSRKSLGKVEKTFTFLFFCIYLELLMFSILNCSKDKKQSWGYLTTLSVVSWMLISINIKAAYMSECTRRSELHIINMTCLNVESSSSTTSFPLSNVEKRRKHFSWVEL